MLWKATSTLLASSADVSMNERLFSAASEGADGCGCQPGGVHDQARAGPKARTGKGLGLLGRDGAQVLEIALVADEHYDDALVGVVTQLLQPPRHVGVCRLLGNVVDEKRADGSAVVSEDGGRGTGGGGAVV